MVFFFYFLFVCLCFVVAVVGWDFLHYFVHFKSVSHKIIFSELL